MIGLEESSTWFRSAYDFLVRFWAGLNLPPNLATTLTILSALLIIALACVAMYYVFRLVLVWSFAALVKRFRLYWGVRFLQRRVQQRLSHIGPALVLHIAALFFIPPHRETLITILHVTANFYIVLMVMLAINSAIKALYDVYQELPIAETRPIKSYVQVVQIILFAVGSIILIAILLRRNPSSIFMGLGAMAAVLMLVFRDTILGLVASVQASANQMVKPGDWVEMPSRQADGTVLEITLNTVKVQNFDRTIVTFPTYALVNESVRNWKGMQESNGRRIKRAIFIDARSVHFLTPEEIATLSRIDLLKDYLKGKQSELTEYNSGLAGDIELRVNGRHLTNIGVFRMYVNNYLASLPTVVQDATFMARQLQPTEKGIPLEIYCFSAEKNWVDYERVQSDIFDHLYAVISAFGLQVYQDFSGSDLPKIEGKGPGKGFHTMLSQ